MKLYIFSPVPYVKTYPPLVSIPSSRYPIQDNRVRKTHSRDTLAEGSTYHLGAGSWWHDAAQTLSRPLGLARQLVLARVEIDGAIGNALRRQPCAVWAHEVGAGPPRDAQTSAGAVADLGVPVCERWGREEGGGEGWSGTHSRW